MPTALEKLGLTPADIGQAAGQAPQAAGQGLAALGLSPADVGQAPDGLGMLESFGQGAAQGVTFGFSDELYGLAAGMIPGGQNREEATSSARARLARADPKAMLAGELAGALILPGGAVKSGATLGARVLRGALAGTAQGALGGAGRAEGSVEERLPAAGSGGALGAAFGGAGAAAAPAIAQGARRLFGRADQTAVQKLLATVDQGDEVGVKARSAIEGIQKAATKGKAATNQAYEKIAGMTGEIEDKASFELLSNKFNRVLDDGGVEFVEGGKRIAALADSVVARLEGGATPAKMEKARQLIAKVTRGASPMNPQEGLHLSSIQREYDNWMFDTLTNKLYRGEEKVVKQIKEARGLSKKYHELFGKYSGGAGTAERSAGGMISKIVNDDVKAEDAVSLIFGANSLGIKGSSQALDRIKQASPEAFEQLQGAHFIKMVTGDGGGDFLPADKIAQRIQKLNTSSLGKSLYGGSLGDLNRFAAKLKGHSSVAGTVVDFIRTRPALLKIIVGGAGGAALSGGDPTTTGVGALILNGLTKGRKGPASAGRLASAAMPGVALTTRQPGNIGGVLGANLGPALAGG